MVPIAVAVPIVEPALGLLKAIVKVSVGSKSVSPFTLIVTVVLASLAAKGIVPLGETPPTKSEPSVSEVPLPATV